MQAEEGMRCFFVLLYFQFRRQRHRSMTLLERGLLCNDRFMMCKAPQSVFASNSFRKSDAIRSRRSAGLTTLHRFFSGAARSPFPTAPSSARVTRVRSFRSWDPNCVRVDRVSSLALSHLVHAIRMVLNAYCDPNFETSLHAQQDARELQTGK